MLDYLKDKDKYCNRNVSLLIPVNIFVQVPFDPMIRDGSEFR